MQLCHHGHLNHSEYIDIIYVIIFVCCIFLCYNDSYFSYIRHAMLSYIQYAIICISTLFSLKSTEANKIRYSLVINLFIIEHILHL